MKQDYMYLLAVLLSVVVSIHSCRRIGQAETSCFTSNQERTGDCHHHLDHGLTGA